ncbi:MAG: hypothetical protein WCA19_15855, partial [Candidatus Acidiferrales bacterium]
GRAVPDYGAPFNFFACVSVTGVTVLGSAGILPAFVASENRTPSRRDAGAKKPSERNAISSAKARVPSFDCFPYLSRSDLL